MFGPFEGLFDIDGDGELDLFEESAEMAAAGMLFDDIDSDDDDLDKLDGDDDDEW